MKPYWIRWFLFENFVLWFRIRTTVPAVGVEAIWHG